MPVENPNDLTIGQTIRFKLRDPHDNNIWTGKIAAICDYDTAVNFENIDSIYQNIQRADGRALPAKEKLTYLLLKVYENGKTVTTHAFATEFIDKSTLELVEEYKYRMLKVYDIDDAKMRDVLKTVQSLGYVAEIVSE